MSELLRITRGGKRCPSVGKCRARFGLGWLSQMNKSGDTLKTMERPSSSRLRPSESHANFGPLLPWSVEPQMYGCLWLVETSWNSEAAHWALWLGCEGTFVGSCHLDAAAWAMGLFRIVDHENLFDPDTREMVEMQLARAFLAWVIACAKNVSSEELPTEEDILDFVLERRYFGLAARILRAVGSKRKRTWRSYKAGLVAKGLQDSNDTGSELEFALQSVLQWKTREEILETIATAFKGAMMPESACELTDGGIDGPSVVRNFLGKACSEVDESFFQPCLHMEDFTYMTLQAVEYYLPSVLRLMMNTPYDDEFWIFLRGFLCHRLEMRRKFGGDELKPRQLQAISDWARYLYFEWKANPPLFELDPNEAESLALAYRQ